MNIFFLHTNPRLAAKYHCDKHVVKMILETAQILCTVMYESEIPQELIPYKKTHAKHPCTLWALERRGNFDWLLELGYNLCHQYTQRYGGKIHKTEFILNDIEALANRYIICNDQSSEMTSPALAMPTDCKTFDSPVDCYRAYYIRHKRWIASWARSKPKSRAPKWYLGAFAKKVLLTMEFKMEKVQSSNLVRIGYDEDSKTMRVEFKNAQVYDYCPITLEDYESILYAESVGKAFKAITDQNHVDYDKVSE